MTQPATPEPAAPSGTAADLSKSPLPTARTLRRRQSLPFQFARFVSFDLRIMRMVAKGHH
jgi:hypothetical protein